MNRKQFFVAVFTALIGAKRWRKLFQPKPSMLVNNAWLPSMGHGSLFNPSSDIQALYMRPFKFHPNCFSMVYPKIGDPITVKRPEVFISQTKGASLTYPPHAA